MKIKTWLVLVLFFCLSGLLPAFADTAVKAEVDKTSISTDDTIVYKLELTTTEKNLPSPTLPKFSGFQVVSQAQSSNMSWEKNQMKATAVFEFILAPEEAGKFKIEPSTIKVAGKAYSTDSFEIEVKPGAQQRPSIPQEKKPSMPESVEPQYTL